MSNVTSALRGGAPATATAAPAALPSLASRITSGKGANGAKGLQLAPSKAALPGLGNASKAGPLGVTVLNNGADGSGYGYVADVPLVQPVTDGLGALVNPITVALVGREALGPDFVVGPNLNNLLLTPFLGGLDGDGGFVDAAVFDGNGTASAEGLLSAAIGSGTNTGNGAPIALGVINDGNNGNGSALGVGILNQGPIAGNGGQIGVGVGNGALSGNGGQIGVGILNGAGSGNGGSLGVGLLNEGDVAHVCVAGTCGSLEQLFGMSDSAPQFEVLPGVVLGGGKDVPVTSSNPLLNVGALTGDNAGNGGAIGVGVLAGDNSAQATLLGACVLCGNNAASNSGSIGAAVLSGNNSGNGTGSGDAILPLGIGAGVLNGNASGNGSTIGAGVLNKNLSGNGGVIGAGVLNGAGSGNGGQIAAGVLNSDGSANAGTIAAGVLNGNNSANGGTVSAGLINNNGATSGTTGTTGATSPVTAGVLNSPNSGGGGVPGGGNPGGNPGGGNPGGNPGGNNGGGNGNNIGDATGEDSMCTLEVKDAKGRIAQTIRRPCKQYASKRAKA